MLPHPQIPRISGRAGEEASVEAPGICRVCRRPSREKVHKSTADGYEKKRVLGLHRNDSIAVDLVDNLAKSDIECETPCNEPHQSAEGQDESVSGEIRRDQKGNQQYDCKESDLQDTVHPECADEKPNREEPPDTEKRSNLNRPRRFCKTQNREHRNRSKGYPEKPETHEGDEAEGVILLPFQDTGNDLCDAAVENGHRKDGAPEGYDTDVVEAQSHSRHTECTQSEWCRICRFIDKEDAVPARIIYLIHDFSFPGTAD